MLSSRPGRARLATFLCVGCFAESSDEGGEQVTAAPGSDGQGSDGPGTDGRGSTSTGTAATSDPSASGPTTVADGSTSVSTEVTSTADGSTSVSDETTAGACASLIETFDVCPGAPWISSGAGSVQCDGHAELTVTSAVDGVLSLALPLPLTGAAATVEIDGAPPTGILAMLRVRDSNPTPRLLAFRINGTGPTLEAYVDDAGNTSVLSSTPYAAADHRWLRMREEAGQVFFETSADGVAFVTFHVVDAPFALDATTIGVAANNYDMLPSDTAVAFSEFQYECDPNA